MSNTDGKPEATPQELMELLLSTQIANVGYPVGCGIAPHPEHVRKMAEFALKLAASLEDKPPASPGPWLDMASAPKDGTHFLWAGDNGEFARRRWTLSVIWWPEFKDCFDSGHWQPLPAPPRPGVSAHER